MLAGRLKPSQRTLFQLFRTATPASPTRLVVLLSLLFWILGPSLRVTFVFVAVFLSFFFFFFVFWIVFFWISTNEAIRNYRAISGLWVEVFWMCSAHAQ